MNQVQNSRAQPRKRAGDLPRTLPASLACVLLLAVLGGCDPSPAYKTLRITESPGVVRVEELPVDAEESGREASAAKDHQEPPQAAEVAEKPAHSPVAQPLVENDTGSATARWVTAEGSLRLLGKVVAPGTSRRLMWSASQIFEGVSTETPVLVVNGREDGPTLCLTAAIHGDELNGIEMVRRVLHDLEPDSLEGAVIGIPIVNLQGFRRGSRYLPDRRDLNRYFPGNAMGSSASRIAFSLFEKIIRGCDALVDLHTGSFYRTNLPQLRADLRYAKIRELTDGFGGMVVLHSVAAPGTLRRAATDAGIPAITMEAGEPQRLQSSKVSQGVNGIQTLLDALGMVDRVRLMARSEPVFYQSTWVRADHGGILFSVVRLGQVTQPGDVLGTVTDPITNEQNLIYSPAKGRVLGMALNQVVMPGFAAFRIGIETDGPPSGAVLASLDWAIEPGDTETGTEPVIADEPDEEGEDPAFADAEEASE